MVIAGLVIPSVRGHGAPLTLSLTWMVDAGETVLAHLGWAFGIYIPTLLGFYAIVIGGQLITTANEGKVRRMLALTAEIAVAALVPALVLAMAAGVTEPGSRGALFVIVPAAGILLFLTVQLGGFNVFDDHHQLRAARRTQERAYAQVRRLAHRSRRRRWIVLLVNVGVATTVGLVPTLVIGPPSLVLPFFSVCLLFSTGLTLAGIPAAEAHYVGGDRLTRVVFGTMTAALYVLGAVGAAQLLALGRPFIAGGLGILGSMAVIVLSSIWPRRTASSFMLDWTLNGAAARAAARSAAKAHRHAVHEIRRLAPLVDAAPPRASLGYRLLAATTAFSDSLRA